MPTPESLAALTRVVAVAALMFLAFGRLSDEDCPVWVYVLSIAAFAVAWLVVPAWLLAERW